VEVELLGMYSQLREAKGKIQWVLFFSNERKGGDNQYMGERGRNTKGGKRAFLLAQRKGSSGNSSGGGIDLWGGGGGGAEEAFLFSQIEKKRVSWDIS